MSNEDSGKQRNIFIFRHYATPPDMAGGTRHYNIARSMLKNGHRPSIFLSNFRHLKKVYRYTMRSLYQVDNFDGVEFVWLNDKPAYYRNDWRRLLNMLSYGINAYRAAIRISIKKKSTETDIIIGSVAHIFAALSAFFAARRLKVRFWLDIGDLWPEGLIQSGVLSPRHPFSMVMMLVSKFLYRKAEKIIVLTQPAKNYLISIGVPHEKIIVIPNGNIIHSEATLKSNRSTPENKSLKITYAGSLAEIYPIEVLIQATHVLTQMKIPVSVDIIGGGVKRPYLKSIVSEYGLGNVSFFGPVKKSQLHAYYELSDILIVLERNVAYGFPNKVIDYSLAGRTILLASDSYYDLPDHIFYKTKPEVDQVVKAVSELYRLGYEYREDLGQKTLEYALTHFDMQNNYRQLIEPWV